MHNATMDLAFSSSFGNITASSYLPVTTAPKIVVRERNKANIPKSSGLYNRVKIGDIATGIAWEMVVPVINVKTFLENDDFGIIFLKYLTMWFVIR